MLSDWLAHFQLLKIFIAGWSSDEEAPPKKRQRLDHTSKSFLRITLTVILKTNSLATEIAINPTVSVSTFPECVKQNYIETYAL